MNENYISEDKAQELADWLKKSVPHSTVITGKYEVILEFEELVLNASILFTFLNKLKGLSANISRNENKIKVVIYNYVQQQTQITN